MMVNVIVLGVQNEEFLCPFPLPVSQMLSLIPPCKTMGLLDQVLASSRGDHPLMIDF
jgi:hypothetical protein